VSTAALLQKHQAFHQSTEAAKAQTHQANRSFVVVFDNHLKILRSPDVIELFERELTSYFSLFEKTET
jgi:hypothetical protein